jgi:hypothetical protein
MLAAELEGCRKSGTIIPLAALHLQNLLHQGPVSSVQIPGDGGTLRFESQAASSLPCG